MAVTISRQELQAAMRVEGADSDTSVESVEVARVLATTTALVERHAPDAPDAIHNEAVVRASSWAYDMPAAQRAAVGDILRNSGALALMLPWRVYRAGTTGAAVAEAAATAATGARLVGMEAVAVSTAGVWVATALVVPTGAVAAIGIDDGPLHWFRTDALTGATAGGDASTALIGGRAYAIERADGRLLFAASTAGARSVWLYGVA